MKAAVLFNLFVSWLSFQAEEIKVGNNKQTACFKTSVEINIYIYKVISTEVLKHAVCLLLPTLISSACSYTKKEKENENENYNRNAVIKRKSSQNKFIHFHLKWEKTCFL